MNRTSVRLVLLAHGSRDPVWRAPFERLRRELTTTLGPGRVRLAYLEFETPTLQETLEEAIRDDTALVRILPLFTASGKHVREDIPEQVARARRAASDTTLELLPPLGDDPRFYDLMRRVALEAVRVEAGTGAPGAVAPGRGRDVEADDVGGG